MKQNPELFAQQVVSNAHVRTRSVSEVQSNQKGAIPMTDTITSTPESKEDQVNQVVNESLALAAPFIPGGPVAVKVAQFSGLAPEVIHLGFVFAHLFSHRKVAPVVAAAVPAPADPVEVAKQQRIAALQAELAQLTGK